MDTNGVAVLRPSREPGMMAERNIRPAVFVTSWRSLVMPTPIAAGPIHHLRLTVSDVDRSRAFYTEVLGFQHVMDLPGGFFLSNGAIGLGLGPSPDPTRAPVGDRFDEARVGLDHLSFSVASREELERAQTAPRGTRGAPRRGHRSRGCLRALHSGVPGSRQHPAGADGGLRLTGRVGDVAGSNVSMVLALGFRSGRSCPREIWFP